MIQKFVPAHATTNPTTHGSHWPNPLRAGLEWLFRVLIDPRRLGRRYARDAWEFPRIFYREWRAVR